MIQDVELTSLIREFQSQFEGCSEGEIQFIESFYKIKLPLVLKEYLRIMGEKSRDVFSGLEVDFSELESINNEFQEILKYHNRLDENPALAFMMNQGYAFYAIKNFELDDPEVYSYIDGDDGLEISVSDNSFSVFLKRMLKMKKRHSN
ncbi:SMI1/KNR4 family protein [Fulvivirga sp. M361]|uniref:SMI1/KNR4 family protein n=1 Tax=Fulvivirga sp. M361 TaxID=2594266 RepID=UPI00117A98DF|nr:SMI1/KNR4 family protein [Fulvivirga sp. M361]TRX58736.1 SMI1/KNR4 family protein [Fulvivirga sp. M361]